MRLVFVTQQVDPGHPALAATVPMLRALSARVDEVVVLADRALPEVLPANCRVRSFGARTQAGRGVKFESALAAELAHRPRPGAVVAHMCPIYAVLAAPLARPVGTKVLLWYTHWSVSRTLRLAERVSNVVLSVDRRTFPLDSRKVRAIGHGIDLSEFACADGEGAHAGLRAVALGRYSQAKGLDVVLRALRLALDGGLDLGSRVKLGHALLRSEVPALLARADVLVNNMRAGATDKVVYEACASCTPAIASNPAFDSLLPDELRFDREDPRDLADRLVALGARSEDERRALGRTLRERVAADHSVESWADSVVEAAT
jgi:glycosyltransferase involved in cell wall biosynthesis